MGPRAYPNVSEKRKVSLAPAGNRICKNLHQRQMADGKKESKCPFTNSIYCKR